MASYRSMQLSGSNKLKYVEFNIGLDLIDLKGTVGYTECHSSNYKFLLRCKTAVNLSTGYNVIGY